jgi:acyl-CoA thioester hydrolase
MTTLADVTRHATRFRVGWAVTDANAHMRSTAYLDAVNDCRMQYLHDRGWSLERFLSERVGPVLLDDQVNYRHELRLGDAATVDMALAGASLDGARVRLRNIVRREPDDKIAASVTSTIAWVDLDRRRLVVPPDDVHAVLTELERTIDYETLL